MFSLHVFHTCEVYVKEILCILALVFFPLTAFPDEIKFQPGDTIDVMVYNSPELSGSFRIYTDGYIRMPLVGKVYATGKTENEMYESIKSAVDVFIKNPYITIIPKFSVSVLGSVNRPGVFTVTGTEKVIEMVAQAGGFNNEASGSITLYRNGKQIKISRKNIMNNNPSLGFLKPGDVVIAEKKAFSRADYSIIISTLSAVSISVYYLSRKY